ncbi:MAG: heavy metal-binding domain-containing protein, partial [Bacteroidota bacterium]
MIIVNTDHIHGREIVETIDIARGSTVRARNVGREISPPIRFFKPAKISRPTLRA